MIRVSVSLANASVTETETLTAGRVGLECAFTFSSEWDDLAKVAVFEGAETIEVALGTASVAVVPPECMATAGYNLRVGVYGLSASTAVVIPTIWAKAGKIKDSAAPDDESLAPATPELVAQIIEKSDTALMLAQSVAEQAASGAFIGEPGVSPTISSTVIENGHRLTITDVNGETVVDVMNGTDGRNGTDGTDGSDGVSPEVTVTSITGGHRVTITDALHPTGQSFNVMDGIGISVIAEPVKLALLQLASKVAYIDEHGQDYYGDLYDALYPLTAISAVYEQSGTVYTTDTLDSLKTDLTVTAVYDGGATQTIPGSDYTLSGNLTEGTSTITVSYGGKTATFDVTVTAVPGVFSVANTLVGCTNSNSATTATEGTAYSGTITAANGYTLTGATVSVTMGEVDITSTAYSNGTISIANVTGNISISVSAVQVVVASISASYTQSGTVYDTDSLDSLKSDLVVTATYSDSSTATVTDYTLSGTLTEGTSTITVSYGGKTATFDVTVTEGNVLYSLQNHVFNNSNPIATDVYPLTEDKDITFAFDVDFAGQQSETIWKLFACINGTSPWSGLAVQGYSPNSNFLQIQNIANKVVVETDMRNYVGNFKYIVTHAIGSGQWHYYYKIGSNNVVDDVITNAFVAITGQLTIGGTASATQVFNGTVNTAKVYSRVLTATEISEFMG